MLHLKLAQTVAFGADALRDLQPDEMERLERSLQTLDSMCREAFQDLRQTYDCWPTSWSAAIR
jgi:signal transduction histidine kinase